MRHEERKPSRRILRLAAGALVPLVASMVCAGEASRCLQATVPVPMVLPDGSEHAPGRLEICFSGKLNPVAGLHRTSLDGHPVGLFRSEVRKSERAGEAEGAYFVFVRTRSGALVLEGCEVARAGHLEVYRMSPRGTVRSEWQLKAAGRDRLDEGREIVRIRAG